MNLGLIPYDAIGKLNPVDRGSVEVVDHHLPLRGAVCLVENDIKVVGIAPQFHLLRRDVLAQPDGIIGPRGAAAGVNPVNVGAAVEYVNILARTTHQFVAAGPPIEAVVAIATRHRIIAVTAFDQVIARIAVEVVIAVAAFDQIVAIVARHRIIAVAAFDQVIASIAGEVVIAAAAFDQVIASTAIHLVVA